MSGYSKINIIYRLQKWMDSVPGQTFLNYAYSWGASIVILGTLFKLTYLPGANAMLFIGMGTEVIVFFLSAFDRPFDKTAEGRELPTHITEAYMESDGIPVSTLKQDGGQRVATDEMPVGKMAGGNQPVNVTILGGVSSAGAAHPASVASVSETHPHGTSGVTAGNGAWIGGQQVTTPEMAEAQDNYVEELKKLVETLEKVNEQSTRLTRDSEEMENLNRTLTGITRVYEMQLKSASQQMGTIDQINEQNRKMAQQIEQLNKIYARMIEAMTINMRAANPHAGSKIDE